MMNCGIHRYTEHLVILTFVVKIDILERYVDLRDMSIWCLFISQEELFTLFIVGFAKYLSPETEIHSDSADSAGGPQAGGRSLAEEDQREQA